MTATEQNQDTGTSNHAMQELALWWLTILPGWVTRVGLGQHPQYIRAWYAREAVGGSYTTDTSTAQIRDEPTNRALRRHHNRWATDGSGVLHQDDIQKYEIKKQELGWDPDLEKSGRRHHNRGRPEACQRVNEGPRAWASEPLGDLLCSQCLVIHLYDRFLDSSKNNRQSITHHGSGACVTESMSLEDLATWWKLNSDLTNCPRTAVLGELAAQWQQMMGTLQRIEQEAVSSQSLANAIESISRTRTDVIAGQLRLKDGERLCPKSRSGSTPVGGFAREVVAWLWYIDPDHVAGKLIQRITKGTLSATEAWTDGRHAENDKRVKLNC